MAVNENFKVHIRVSDLSDDILATHFAGAGKSVSTLKAEVESLKNQLPGDLDDVARQAAEKAKDKSAAEKRALIRKVLYPICLDGADVSGIEKKITSTPDPKLDEILVAAMQRRMLVDILLPMEVFRPTAEAPPDEGDKASEPKLTRALIYRAADLDAVSVDDLKELFRKRCTDVLADRHWAFANMPRDNPEKRRAAAFLLLVVSQVEIPGAASDSKKAEPAGQDQKDPDKDQAGEQLAKMQQAEPTARQGAFPRISQRRVEAVCGVRDFTQACEDYALVAEYTERLMIDAIQRDMGNYQYPLTVRIYRPEKFVDELVAVMSRMKIAPKDPPGFRKAVEEKLTDMKGKINSSGPVLEELKKLMEAGGIQLAAPDAVAFEREVDGLLSANAVGFLGKYQMLLRRTQDLALLVQRQDRQMAELKAIQDERIKQLAARSGQEKQAQEELLQARAKLRELALRCARSNKNFSGLTLICAAPSNTTFTWNSCCKRLNGGSKVELHDESSRQGARPIERGSQRRLRGIGRRAVPQRRGLRLDAAGPLLARICRQEGTESTCSFRLRQARNGPSSGGACPPR